MKKISSNRRGLYICIVLYVLSCVSLFVFCEKISYRYIFDEKITALQTNTQVTADSLSQPDNHNLNSKSEDANN